MWVMATQYSDCTFSPKDFESSTGAHWIMIELHDKIDALPRNIRVLGLELQDPSDAHTDELAAYLREHVKGIMVGTD
jgi:hypothetical protein